MNLLQRGKITLRMKYLIHRKYELTGRAASHHLFLWQLERANLTQAQAILLLVLRYLPLSLRDGHVIARVNDEIILALDFRSLPLNIIHKHLIQVHVQTHELGEALLTQQSLCLQVHL